MRVTLPMISSFLSDIRNDYYWEISISEFVGISTLVVGTFGVTSMFPDASSGLLMFAVGMVASSFSASVAKYPH